MDGVATPIIGRPRPLPGHDTPNPAYHPHTLNYEEPVFWKLSSPRTERFMMTVMALIIKANIGLIMRMVSFIYSPGVCDVITIDLRY